MDRPTPKQTQRPLQVCPQDFQGAGDSHFPVSGEPVSIGATAEHRPRTQANCLDYIRSSTNAAIKQDLGSSIDGRHDFWKYL